MRASFFTVSGDPLPVHCCENAADLTDLSDGVTGAHPHREMEIVTYIVEVGNHVFNHVSTHVPPSPGLHIHSVVLRTPPPPPPPVRDVAYSDGWFARPMRLFSG